jgi:glucan phosphoethanolaminetransferase (alkaline phosphatase superfamily)
VADGEARPSSAPTARLRRFAHARKRYGLALLVVPLLMVLATDARIRGDRLIALPSKYLGSYAFALLESAALWGLLLYAASARRGAFRWVASVLLVLLVTLAWGIQIYFHRQYSTYLNLDATLFGTSLGESVFGQIKADGRNLLLSLAPPLLLAVTLVWLSRRLVRPVATRRTSIVRALAVPLTVAVFLIPCSYQTVQASTPDVIYFHAIGGFVKTLFTEDNRQVRPGRRTPPPLPELFADAPPSDAKVRARNVLFILTESVRADLHCSEHVESCPIAPKMNEAVPDRIPLLQMRSNDSTTAISLAVLWSGLEPVRSRTELHNAPVLFDYARAAGIDNAYWTSHHMLFANSRLWVQDLPTTKQCGASDIDPEAGLDLGGRDELLVERVEKELGTLKEPFFAVAHFGNTHVPYRIDPNDAPFTPYAEDKAPDKNEEYRNYFKNAVHLQDRTMAELVRFVRKSAVSSHTVIVFTSDHAEAFREHDQLGHTGSLYDEEIHVPFWIDAPKGTLSSDEEAHLRALKDKPAFHTDITPTILDLMGLWNEPQLASFRSKMVGSSLLRDRPPPPALAMTNCSGVWSCVFRNWGMMQGFKKLESREWDTSWRCYDVEHDPLEKNDLGPNGCADLRDRAVPIFGGTPSEVLNTAGGDPAPSKN